MQKTQMITFSEKSCHIDGENPQSIAHDFEKMHELPKLIAQLKSHYSLGMKVKINNPSNHSVTCDIAIERNLSEDDIIQFLKSRALSLFGYPADQLCIDYVIKNKIDEQKQTITAMAAHASLITDIQRCFKQEKMPIDAIQINGEMNLLPWRENQKKEYQKIMVLNTMLILFFILLIFCVFKLFLTHETRQLELKEKNDVIRNQKIVLMHPHQNAILLKKCGDLQSEKLNAVWKNKKTEILLSDIANALPNDVMLTELIFNAKGIILTGVGNQLTDVHAYANALQMRLKNKKISLTEMHNDTQNKSLIHFTMLVSS